MQKRTIVEVEWLDAWSNSVDYRKGGDHTGLKAFTVGYLMEWTDDSIVLAAMTTRDEQGTNIFVIPDAYIVKVTEFT